ncbi:hypothetical protein DL98DRAFT_577317 [Cadophora sp. DSE1049]|nr:hypothetical protein DL98DRAFT_577317 [Cadophora sp. DSE1049]
MPHPPPPPPSEAPSYHTVQPSYPLDTYPPHFNPGQHEQVKVYSMQNQNQNQNTGYEGNVPGQEYGGYGGYGNEQPRPVYKPQYQSGGHSQGDMLGGHYYADHGGNGQHGVHGGGKYNDAGPAGPTVVVVKKGHRLDRSLGYLLVVKGDFEGRKGGRGRIKTVESNFVECDSVEGLLVFQGLGVKER